MKPEIIGIRRVFKDNDPELYRETVIKCIEVGADGKYHRKSIMVTEAEKWMLESIAMRIFLNHKKYIDMTRTRLEGDKTELRALLTIEKL